MTYPASPDGKQKTGNPKYEPRIMFVKMLKSKLHRAVVTNTRVHYPGSIAIDSELMEAAEIVPYESVLIADLNNGNRLETYAVPAEAGSRKVVILGAAARLIKRRDVIIIFSFAYCSPEEAKKLKPKILLLDQSNRIKEVS